MSENTVQIEINGVKMEVDLRHAKRIETIKVGTRVKVLSKVYDGYHIRHGVVIGFEPFQKLPTIIVAAASITYSEAKVDFVYFNAETKDTELVVAVDDDKAAIDKEDFLKQVDREVAEKEAEIRELKDRKQYFLDKFQCYWTPAENEDKSVAA